MRKKTLLALLLLFCGWVAGGTLYAQADEVVSNSYRLADRDLIRFAVQGEPETAVEQRLDGEGKVRVPYLGDVVLRGHTVREAEKMIEELLIENKIYHRLQATIRVVEYSTKEVSILGQIRTPGKVAFPIEANKMDILDVITESGGFTGIARSREVRVTRSGGGGNDGTFTVDVDKMLAGRGSANAEPPFYVLPGDVIFVPERLF